MIDIDRVRERLGCAACAAFYPRGEGLPPARFDADSVRKFAAHGIRRVEIGGYPRAHYDHADPAYLASLRLAFAEYGVRPVTAHCPDLLRDPFADAAAREAAIEETALAAAAARSLGAELMVVHCRPHREGVNTMRALLARTRHLDMRFTAENLPFERVEDVKAFVEAVDRSNYGLTLDVGHVAVKLDPLGPGTWQNGRNLLCEAGNAARAVAACGGKLWHVHLHDFVDRDHCAPFVGKMRWVELFEALFAAGYKGEFLFESEYPDEETVLRNVQAFPDRLEAALRGAK